MTNPNNRLDRERETIRVMIGIYCRGHHHMRGDLCDVCRGLLDYALRRVDKCPFQENKPVCARCTVHCYKPNMREQIRQVMRYAGPRLIWCHPVLALQHLWDEVTRTQKK